MLPPGQLKNRGTNLYTARSWNNLQHRFNSRKVKALITGIYFTFIRIKYDSQIMSTCLYVPSKQQTDTRSGQKNMFHKAFMASMRLSILATISLFVLIQPVIAGQNGFYPCAVNLAPSDAMIVADTTGRIIYKKNAETKHVPASTLKLLTSIAAIDTLGLTYRFKTEFYTDSENNLKVKGYGDPLLISEILDHIARVLSKKSRCFKDLILDDRYFENAVAIPGNSSSDNPYDAPQGALCANFNTIFFSHDRQGNLVSAEQQTPLIPFAQKKIRSTKKNDGRYTLTHKQDEAVLYAGHLLAYFLKKHGVHTGKKVYRGKIVTSDRLLYTYYSKFTLGDIIKKLARFSNNFIANQIFLSLGAVAYGPPANLDKSIRFISDYAHRVLNIKDIKIVEGSGLSRQNRISAHDMLTILERFMPYRYLLKRRENILFKSGTLKGIRTRAGYIETDMGPFPFVVFMYRDSSIQNGPATPENGHNFSRHKKKGHNRPYGLCIRPIVDCINKTVGYYSY